MKKDLRFLIDIRENTIDFNELKHFLDWCQYFSHKVCITSESCAALSEEFEEFNIDYPVMGCKEEFLFEVCQGKCTRVLITRDNESVFTGFDKVFVISGGDLTQEDLSKDIFFIDNPNEIKEVLNSLSYL
ncbi:MAG: hypothetical protein ACOCWO_03190 [Candidatus Muiribacteriaceae bacterium]